MPHLFWFSMPINYAIYKRIYYNCERASVWSSPAPLPFSERGWIDSKSLCKRLLGQAESSASGEQFVGKGYGDRKRIITQKLANSRKIMDLRLGRAALPTKQGGFVRPEFVRDLSLEESQRQPPALDMIAESFQCF